MDVSAAVAVESADAAGARSAAGAEGRAGADAPAYGGCGSAKAERGEFQFARLAAAGLRAAGFRAARGGHAVARHPLGRNHRDAGRNGGICRPEPATGGPRRAGARRGAGGFANWSESNEFRAGDAARVANGNDLSGDAILARERPGILRSAERDERRSGADGSGLGADDRAEFRAGRAGGAADATTILRF